MPFDNTTRTNHHHIHIEAGKTKWTPKENLGVGEEVLTIYKEYNGQEIEVARLEIKLSENPTDASNAHYNPSDFYIKKTLNNSNNESPTIRITAHHLVEELVKGEDNAPTHIHLGSSMLRVGKPSMAWFSGDDIWIKDDGVYVKILSTTEQIMAFDDLSSMPQLDFL